MLCARYSEFRLRPAALGYLRCKKRTQAWDGPMHEPVPPRRVWISGIAVVRHLRQYRVQVERSRFLPWRELGEVRDLPRHQRLHLVQHENVIYHPVPVNILVEVGPLEWVETEVVDLRHSKLHQGLLPDGRRSCALLRQHKL